MRKNSSKEDIINKKDKKISEQVVVSNEDKKEILFHEDRRSIRELVAPEGVDARKPEYIVINDGGINLYTMSLYIHKLPRNTVFASTFAPLFNFPGVTANVFITPLGDNKSQQIIDKRVKTLDVELGEAQDSGDPNRIRKMQNKYLKAEHWASRIEEGDNSLFSVRFLFTIQGESEEELYRKVGDLRMTALQKQIELVACYGVQKEAFMSTYPLNRTAKFGNKDFIKAHVLDKDALGDIFNHTSNSFMHSNGVFLGHYIGTMQAFFYDPMDKAHDGYGIIFAGGTGTGKSATIKMLQSRLVDFGYRFRTIDIESRSTHGEYYLTALACGGVNFEIKPNSENVLNPFEINVEMEFDESTGVEYPVLRLAEKKAYLVDLLIAMVMMGNAAAPPLALDEALSGILSNICNLLYEERGIYDGVPESIYQSCEDGLLSSGRTKKRMPTMADVLKKILIERHLNDNPLHDEAYQLLVDALGKQVKGVYYGKESMRFFTKDEYEALEIGEYGRRYVPYENGQNGKEQVVAIIGSKAYFDGETTMRAEFSTPYVNYDMSQIPESDRAFVLLVLLGYMEENDIKLNSANPYRTTPLVTLVDELHILFPYERARRCIGRFYRTMRKRWGSPWVATQSLADIGDNNAYPELEGVYKNTDTFFVFRHKEVDYDFFKKNTELTDSQIHRVFNLGYDPTDPDVTAEQKKRHAGEVCVIDCRRVAFVKVDYLEDSEAAFVETNVEKIKQKVSMNSISVPPKEGV